MSPITFETTLFEINDWTILLLPQEVSKKLPTRAMTMVEGTVNNTPFKAVLEPDGRGSHWMKIDDELQKSAGVKAGSKVTIEITPFKDWIEPEIPEDVKKALVKSPKEYELWQDITPIARWDWIRWIRAVKSEETRKKHIDVMLSKLSHGERRPCCFNRNLCSEPYVARNWQLLIPTQ